MRKSLTCLRDTSVSVSRSSQPLPRPIVLVPGRERNPPPGVRPLQDGDLRDRLGRAVGVPVACLDDGEAVAGLDAAVGDRERGIQGDTLAIEHSQRDGAELGTLLAALPGRVPPPPAVVAGHRPGGRRDP